MSETKFQTPLRFGKEIRKQKVQRENQVQDRDKEKMYPSLAYLEKIGYGNNCHIFHNYKELQAQEPEQTQLYAWETTGKNPIFYTLSQNPAVGDTVYNNLFEQLTTITAVLDNTISFSLLNEHSASRYIAGDTNAPETTTLYAFKQYENEVANGNIVYTRTLDLVSLQNLEADSTLNYHTFIYNANNEVIGRIFTAWKTEGVPGFDFVEGYLGYNPSGLFPQQYNVYSEIDNVIPTVSNNSSISIKLEKDCHVYLYENNNQSDVLSFIINANDIGNFEAGKGVIFELLIKKANNNEISFQDTVIVLNSNYKSNRYRFFSEDGMNWLAYAIADTSKNKNNISVIKQDIYVADLSNSFYQYDVIPESGSYIYFVGHHNGYAPLSIKMNIALNLSKLEVGESVHFIFADADFKTYYNSVHINNIQILGNLFPTGLNSGNGVFSKKMITCIKISDSAFEFETVIKNAGVECKTLAY